MFKIIFDRRNIALKPDRLSLFDAVLCVLLLLLILYSIIVRVQMLMLGVSLWMDEASLAESILDRSFGEMLTPPLASLQTAPALYLIAVKALATAFGASEAALRLCSFLCLIGLLAAQGLLLRKVFHVRMLFTLFSVAISATFLYYMQYSAELKPYMGDAMFFFVVLLGYHAYREGRLGAGVRGALLLSLVFSVSILFSTPAAFAGAAVFIAEFLSRCYRKDRKKLLLAVLGGAVFAIIFAVNYLLWLKPVATDDTMIWYWSDRRFVLNIFAHGIPAIEHDLSVIKDLLSPLGVPALTLPFAAAGFIISIAKQRIYSLVILIFFALLLIAASVEKYPVMDRLWMFLYAIIFVYVFVFLNSLRLQPASGQFPDIAQKVLPLFLAFLILAPNLSFTDYGKGADWTIREGENANPLIEYVSRNIQEGESLYGCVASYVILKYKNGYDTNKIGNVSTGNIIYGTLDYEKDAAAIAETGGAYVLLYHDIDRYDSLINLLEDRGFLELVMEANGTPLYWWTDDETKLKL